MKITKISLALHQIGRFREILAILIKYDFGEFGQILSDRPDLISIDLRV